MNYTNKIDTFALAGKLAVESSAMSRENKEYAKLGIEGLQILLKEMQQSQVRDLSVMGLDLTQVAWIKTAAKQCGLKRVVLFPCNINGQVQIFFRMYEGDRKAFCNMIGIQYIESNLSARDEAEIEKCIKQYGIILYERDEGIASSVCDK